MSEEKDKKKEAVEVVNENNIDDILAKAKKPVLVDFFAEWCAPCKAQEAILDKLAKDYKEAIVVKVNVDESPELAAKYEIRSIPTMIIFKKQEPKKKLHGVQIQSKLEDELKAL